MTETIRGGEDSIMTRELIIMLSIEEQTRKCILMDSTLKLKFS